MDEAEKRVHNNPKHRSIIQRIFEGEFRQSITCDMCDHASHTAQPFQDLSLDILSRQRDLLSSLAYSVRPETLSDDNMYKCEKCGGKSRAKKRVTIHVAPPILAIHLKRFSASGLRKNSALVEYPEVLDLNPYMSDGVEKVGKYRLIGTVCHAGFDYSGMASGHYIAKCKSSSGTWHEFDDMNVCPFDNCISDDRCLMFRWIKCWTIGLPTSYSTHETIQANLDPQPPMAFTSPLR
jgi:ubiquitin carboxyl-terminal hydrolase 36/42